LLAENKSTPLSLSNMKKERQRFSRGFPVKAPSSMAIPSNFSKLQKDEFQIACSRPRDAEPPIPITLLHPIFRQFLDNCEHHQPDSADNKLVLELIGKMANFYQNENERASDLRDILTDNGIPVVTHTVSVENHHYPTDGAVLYKGHVVAFFEVKGEIGSKGAEPYAQVVVYYTHWTRAPRSSNSEHFNFPCFLITVFGNIILSFLAMY
jgi:hypothetical protein